MNKNIIVAVALLMSTMAFAQVNLERTADITPTRSSFLDASGYTEYPEEVGKGINFPRTDLTTFSFNTEDLGQFQYSKTAFDGFIVYNTKEGRTGANAATQGIQVDVEPGFYYFSNPTADENTADVSTGKWVRIGGSSTAKKVEIGAIETATDKVLGDKPVYAVKGEFTLTNGDNGTRIAFPTGMKSLYSINIFRKDGDTSHLVGSSLYKYNLTPATTTEKNIIFGSGIISTAYPKGTYEYVLEYLK